MQTKSQKTKALFRLRSLEMGGVQKVMLDFLVLLSRILLEIR